MIVSRLAIVTEDFVICCYQVTKARGTASPLRLLHGVPCNFGRLTDLALWVFTEMRVKNCAYPNPDVS